MNEREQSEREDYQRECNESVKNHYQNKPAMNELEKRHLEVIKSNLSCDLTYRLNGKEHTSSKCAEVTKEYAEKFAEWISINGHIPNRHYKGQFITTEFLWELFINEQKKDI